jgi:hypothetical protein
VCQLGTSVAHLPELALVFEHSEAPQPEQRIATTFFFNDGGLIFRMGVVVSEDGSRDLHFGQTNGSAPYRCVTSATN